VCIIPDVAITQAVAVLTTQANELKYLLCKRTAGDRLDEHGEEGNSASAACNKGFRPGRKSQKPRHGNNKRR
jgi:hypothetical protein